MKTRSLLIGICTSLVISIFGCNTQQKSAWKVHDKTRPCPVVITPGQNCGDAPSDAIVLFDGTDLSQWQRVNGQEPAWKVENGYMEVTKGSSDIQTKQPFGSCQLHIEWAAPEVVTGKDQGRGNSGVFLMSKYEVQVLDSFENTTYADGQAAAIYGQKPPMVNVCRPPGQLQSYDIIFHRPIFKGEKIIKPGTVTVFQNGVLVQDNWILKGSTAHKTVAVYEPHPDKLPIMLQNHKNPVKFRNIWIRELDEEQ